MQDEGFKKKIGVLALQGGFSLHSDMLHKAGALACEVRYPDELSLCQGLIIPGGESTTLMRLIETNDLLAPLLTFSKTKPIFGTCAGMILMARLGILQISVARNAYGSQRDSFQSILEIKGRKIPAIFIRAPKVTGCLCPSVKVLATFQGNPVLVQQGIHWGCSFHPELTNDPSLHQAFIKDC